MAKRRWYKNIGTGLLIALTLVMTACSAQSSTEEAPPDTNGVARSITVYESPT